MLLSLLLSMHLLPGTARADGHSKGQGGLTHPGAPRMSLCSHLYPSGGHRAEALEFHHMLLGGTNEAGVCVGSRAIAEQYVWMDLVAIGEIFGISCTCCDSGLVWFGGTVWFCLCRRAWSMERV